MSEVVIAGIFTIVGAVIGFGGTCLQSWMDARKERRLVTLQSHAEIQKTRYFEKEKLYSDIISFLPQYIMSIDLTSQKIKLSTENQLMLHSFKARLCIYANKEIYDGFYKLLQSALTQGNATEVVDTMNDFTELLISDLKTEQS